MEVVNFYANYDLNIRKVMAKNSYIIEMVHCDKFYAAKNEKNGYIVFDGKGFSFDLGDQVCIQNDFSICNETKKSVTQAIIYMHTFRMGAISLLERL